MAQNVFERTEKKYMLTKAQYADFTARVNDKMVADQFGKYTISNLYYDTDDYNLIRQSIEKPVYKEKLRLRSYGMAKSDTYVFLELKKKFNGVVYKRREKMLYEDAMRLLNGGTIPENSQILREIRFFLCQYELSPKVYLSYDRIAMSGIEDSELRITFDTNVCFRQSKLRLDNGIWGTPILSPENVLMEIKVCKAMPLWLSQILSELKVFPTTFSKYGTCYKEHIIQNIINEKEVRVSA